MSETLENKHMREIDRPDVAASLVRIEPWPRRVRAVFASEVVADSDGVLLLLEQGHLPVYYFPSEDVRMDLMTPTATTTTCPRKGDASYWTIQVAGRAAEDAAWAYQEPIEDCPDIKGYVAFYWNKIDRWYEEDDEVFVHPRDPYHRVDVLHASRHVRIEIESQIVVETSRPRLLFETGLPIRYYIPPLDVRMDLLQATETSSRCPYKGIASYWSVVTAKGVRTDLAWSYPAPIPECPKIENLICFFNEKVDLFVDGELQERPTSPWS